MRINKWLAANTNLSRRKADEAVVGGLVTVNGKRATIGQIVSEDDDIRLRGNLLVPQFSNLKPQLWMLNKPTGYVCSREGQGNQTIYELLPPELQHLNPVGRLDKNSSGLLLLTNDGNLLNELAHPSRNHIKIYRVKLDKALQEKDLEQITKQGVDIGDGRLSKFSVHRSSFSIPNSYEVRISEGRNRQIRRTFEALDYKVQTLHRTNSGEYALLSLKTGEFSVII